MFYKCKTKSLKIYRGYIPKGYTGTIPTVNYIDDLIKNGSKDFCVRQKALCIFRMYGVKPKNYLGEISTLFEWVKNNNRKSKGIWCHRAR